jgi:hypothetical protein
MSLARLLLAAALVLVALGTFAALRPLDAPGGEPAGASPAAAQRALSQRQDDEDGERARAARADRGDPVPSAEVGTAPSVAASGTTGSAAGTASGTTTSGPTSGTSSGTTRGSGGTAPTTTRTTAPVAAAPAVTGGAPSAPACTGAPRALSRVAGGTTAAQWTAAAPADDATFDLTGITSSAYPASGSPFTVGGSAPAQRTCVQGGTLHGSPDPQQTWSVFHDQYNAACLRIIARDWMQVRGLRCDGVEDGIRPLESAVNANNTRFYVSGTYLTDVRDDCMENDYTVGGVLYDNLWEQCNTGLSERPSGGRSWATPAGETVVLDHMLIGLYRTPHDEGGRTVLGENALFKWSSSANHLVIRCSTFMVDAMSLNGAGSMAVPAGTVVDDSACPGHPSTIVWLGGGAYPAPTAGLRVVSDRAVWTGAVAAWKAAHGW